MTDSIAVSGSTSLKINECHEVLRECGWGMLSTVEMETASPYTVPVAYAFDGEDVYVATGRGRKLRALERNANVCLTVASVKSLAEWRSVVLMGSASFLSDASSRAAAVRAFARQHRVGGVMSATAAARLILARTLRIRVRELSGRAQGQGPDRTPAAAGTQIDTQAVDQRQYARLAMDSIRRVVRSLRDLSQIAQRDHQLTAARLFVLREIGAQPGRTVADVAREVVADRSVVAEIVERLLQFGLIVRTQPGESAGGDELCITEAGRLALAAAPETVQERLVAGFLAMPNEDQRRLAELFVSWVAISGLQETPPTMFLEPARLHFG
jgi:nitroimidazol reductase NimA-like FMN-containing flavoprotein (pyridoxamine 5'-phosphate oxidase superfamily)/DNA-binding MarR family transcriptional regulator